VDLGRPGGAGELSARRLRRHRGNRGLRALLFVERVVNVEPDDLRGNEMSITFPSLTTQSYVRLGYQALLSSAEEWSESGGDLGGGRSNEYNDDGCIYA
jgi:hypothetical protein